MTQPFTPRNFSRLAREIAMDILELDEILALHQLDAEEWQQIQADVRFQGMLDDMRRQWNSADNTKERVRVKAATGIEMALDTVVLELMNPTIPLAQRVSAFQMLAKLGDLEIKPDAPVVAPGDRVTISINIGGDPKVVEKAAITIDAEPVPSPSPLNFPVQHG
jgi:hypothetical protein